MAVITATVISAVLGMFTSSIPDVIQIFKSKQNTINEVKLIEARSKFQEKESQLKVDELNAQADIDETKSIYANDAAFSNSGFIGALRSSVRPIITYFFFFLFIAIKAYAFYHGAVIQEIDIINLIPIIWDVETASLFGAIMGFWFGSRNIEKSYKHLKKQG